jgi:hypothetical protein
MRKLLVVVLAATLLPATLQAQSSCTGLTTCTAVTTVQMTVPTIFSLDLNGSTRTLTEPTLAVLETGGFMQTDDLGFSVKANQGWRVHVRANSAYWSFNNVPGVAKPATDLTWSATSAGSYSHISATDDLQVGLGDPTSGTTVPMFFRVLYPAGLGLPANAAGLYELGLTFTITAQ